MELTAYHWERVSGGGDDGGRGSGFRCAMRAEVQRDRRRGGHSLLQRVNLTKGKKQHSLSENIGQVFMKDMDSDLFGMWRCKFIRILMSGTLPFYMEGK